MPEKRVLDRRVEAAQRQEAYAELSTQQKYDRAVKRGHEDTREALRLADQLEREKA